MAFNQAAGSFNLPNGNWVPTIYSQKVLKFFRKASVVEAITNTDYTGEIANMGDTVTIIKEPVVTVSSYVRGQQIVTSDLADDNLTLAVDHANYFAFRVDDIEAKQSHISWEPLATSSAAYKLKDTFDTEILSYMVGQAPSANILGSTSSPVTVDPTSTQLTSTIFTPLNVLSRLSRFLDVQNVPTENRWAVASPHFYELLQMDASKIMDAKFTGDDKSQVRNGKILDKQVHGFNLYMSNNVPDAGGATPSYREVLCGHMSSTATASQIAQTETYRDPQSFGDIVRGLHVYGRKVLRTEAIALAYWH